MGRPKREPALSDRRGRAPWFVRSAGWLAIGTAVGAAVGWARPQIEGPAHYEMMLASPVLIVLALLLIWSLRRVLFWRVLEYLAVGMLCLWGGFLLGGDVLLAFAPQPHPSFWGFALLHAILGVVVGLILIGVWRVWYPIRRGPYCPRCDYCLIGSAAEVCPEYGRAFRLEELGVTAEELEMATG